MQCCTQAVRGARPAHLPITIYILELLFRSWSGPLCNYCSVMLWAACALGFFGFLPSGEFTTVPTGNSLLLPSDVRIDSWENPSFLAVTLCSRKNRLFWCRLHFVHWPHTIPRLPCSRRPWLFGDQSGHPRTSVCVCRWYTF